DQHLVGLAHPPHVLPGVAERIRALPYEEPENEGDCRVETGERNKPPSDRQQPNESLRCEIDALPRPGPRQGSRFILDCDQIEAHSMGFIRLCFISLGEYARSIPVPRDLPTPCHRLTPLRPRTACDRGRQ